MTDAEDLVEKIYKCRKCDFTFHDKDYVLSHVILEHLKTCSCCGEPCDHLAENIGEPHHIWCCIQGSRKDFNEFCPNCQNRMRQMIAWDPSGYKNSTSWINLPLPDDED